MSAPDGAGFLIVVDAVWLLLLGAGALVLRREVAVLQQRVRLAGGRVPDALEVGAPAPRDATARRVVLFLFPHCEPCHELAPQLATLSRPELLEVVVPSLDGGAADDALLARVPASIEVRTGSDLDKDFDVRSGPLAIAVGAGIVVAKGYVNSAAEIEFLLDEVDPP